MFTVEGEQRLHLASATGVTTSSVVWVAGYQSLDLKLYHATKYIVLAEINIRQCLMQKIICNSLLFF